MSKKKALLIVLGIEVLIYGVIFGVEWLRKAINPCMTGGVLASPLINLITSLTFGLIGIFRIVMILKKKEGEL